VLPEAIWRQIYWQVFDDQARHRMKICATKELEYTIQTPTGYTRPFDRHIAEL
jgi:hypothetical protein